MKNHLGQSADDLLWHLSRFSRDEIVERFTAAFDRIFQTASEVIPLRGKRFDVALDFPDWSCRCKGAEGVVWIHCKRGTSTGYKLATINIVKPGLRSTLPVHKHPEMKGGVEELSSS